MSYDAKEYFEQIWGFWRGCKFHHGKPGPRGEALKEWLKHAKTEEMANRIFEALKAQVRYAADMEQNSGRPDRMPHLRTWLHQQRYEDEIGSHSELREKFQPVNCVKCGKEAHGRFKLCAYCFAMEYGSTVGIVRDFYRKHGLQRKQDETPEQHRSRLRELARGWARQIGRVA